MSSQERQGGQASCSAQGAVQPANPRPSTDRRTPMLMDLTDKLLIYYNEGSPRPPPDPDRDCVIYRINQKGEEVFEHYWARTRFPYGRGTVELY